VQGLRGLKLLTGIVGEPARLLFSLGRGEGREVELCSPRAVIAFTAGTVAGGAAGQVVGVANLAILADCVRAIGDADVGPSHGGVGDLVGHAFHSMHVVAGAAAWIGIGRAVAIRPSNTSYQHNLRWGDGNGHSHVRASLLGASLTVPFVDQRLTLGTWQQIVFIDFDNRPRSRELVLQLMGE